MTAPRGVKKRRELDQAFLSTYKDFKVEYPFCTLSKDGKEYFRYLEDGRYENITIKGKLMSFSYGTRTDSILGLQNDDGFHFKVLGNVHNIITNEDFEIARKLLFSNYRNYLAGSHYLAKEVQDMIDLDIITKLEAEEHEQKNNNREKKEALPLEKVIEQAQEHKPPIIETDSYGESAF